MIILGICLLMLCLFADRLASATGLFTAAVICFVAAAALANEPESWLTPPVPLLQTVQTIEVPPPCPQRDLVACTPVETASLPCR